MGIYTSISLSAIRRKIVDQAWCFENTHRKSGLSPFLEWDCPLFLNSDTGFALLSGSDFVLMLIIGLHFVYEHYFTIKSDPMNYARSAWPRFSQSPSLISFITLIWKCLRTYTYIDRPKGYKYNSQSIEKTKFTKRSNDEKPHS